MNFTCRTIFSPLMPLIEDEFAISHARASSLFTLISAGYGFSLFFAGLFAGRFGYKRSIFLSLAGSAILLIIVPWLKTFSSLALCAVLIGISTGIYLPSIIPIMTEYYEEQSWGKAIAIHDSAASLSIFGAPFIALLLLRYMEWRHMLLIFGLFFALSAVSFLFLCREVKAVTPVGGTFTSLLSSRSLWAFGTVWIFAAAACLGIYFVIPLYLTKEIGMDIRYANTIFGISRIGGVFVALVAGFLVDKVSLRKTIFVLTLSTGILTATLAWGNPSAITFILFAQASIATGFFPIGLVAISRMFTGGQRSMATGLIVTLGVIFGLGIIPYLFGLAGDHLSFRFGILVFGSAMIAVSGLTGFLKGLK